MARGSGLGDPIYYGLDGDNLIWSRYSTPLTLYHIPTGTSRVIAQRAVFPILLRNTVVWANPGLGDPTIYGYNIGTGATTVLVRRLEQEDDDGVLAELLRALGRLGSREALEVLAKHAEPGGVLKRRSPMVRAAAVEGLARMPSREARALVELYTHDKELTVRRAAEAALR